MQIKSNILLSSLFSPEAGGLFLFCLLDFIFWCFFFFARWVGSLWC